MPFSHVPGKVATNKLAPFKDSANVVRANALLASINRDIHSQDLIDGANRQWGPDTDETIEQQRADFDTSKGIFREGEHLQDLAVHDFEHGTNFRAEYETEAVSLDPYSVRSRLLGTPSSPEDVTEIMRRFSAAPETSYSTSPSRRPPLTGTAQPIYTTRHGAPGSTFDDSAEGRDDYNEMYGIARLHPEARWSRPISRPARSRTQTRGRRVSTDVLMQHAASGGIVDLRAGGVGGHQPGQHSVRYTSSQQGSVSPDISSGRLAHRYIASLQEGDTEAVVHSYSTPIGWRTRDAMGASSWVVPAVKYSRTTSKHQGKLRNQLSRSNFAQTEHDPEVWEQT